MKLKYIIAIILLLIINILVVYKNYIIKRKSKEGFLENPSIEIRQIPNFVLYDLNDKSFSSDEILSSSPYVIFVFFSPSDCAFCLYEMELWKTISREAKVKVIGIATYLDKKKLTDWVKNFGISFTVLYDLESKLKKKFGIINTPLKVLANDKGEILLVDSVRITPAEQESFINILYKITEHEDKNR